MHLVSEIFHLISNFIDLLACGVQFHRDDHGCPLVPRSEILPSEFAADFFSRRKNLCRKIKNPLGCEWVGIFRFIPVITNSPLAPYLGGTQNRNQYE
jgi:hypothetical protein